MQAPSLPKRTKGKRRDRPALAKVGRSTHKVSKGDVMDRVTKDEDFAKDFTAFSVATSHVAIAQCVEEALRSKGESAAKCGAAEFRI